MSEQSPILSQRLLDAQAGVLGSMLIDPDTVPLVLSRVTERDFPNKVSRQIFQAIRDRFRAGERIDAILVRETLGGGVDGPWTEPLSRLMDDTVTAANVESYVDALLAAARLSRLRDLGARLAEADSGDEAEQLLAELQEQRVERPGVQAMDLAEGFERFLDRHDGESRPRYLTWGVPVLDERIFAEPGDMVVLGGYPSDGKTALALQFAAGIAKSRRVGFFSFESTRDKLFDRLVSRSAMLSYTRIKRNQLTEADYKDLLELRPELTAPALTLIDAAGMTALDIQAYAQAHRYEVVFVDYLQKIAAPRGARQTDFERVSAISSALQQFGRISETTVVALSQLSRPERDARTRKIRPPALSDLRSSGQIEQDADVVLFLYREDYDDKRSNRILRIAKNKEGEAMDYVRFRFDGDLQTFSRIAPAPEPPAEAPKRQPPRQVSFWEEDDSGAPTPWDGEKGGGAT